MLEIFNLVFTDPNFLGAFSQTIIIIVLGFFFMRKGILDVSAKKTLTALIWKLAVPCFAFNAFMQDFEWNSFRSSLAEFVLAFVFYIFLISLGKLLLHKKGKDFSTVGGFLMAIVIGFSAPISVSLSIACMQYHKEEVMASRACVISTLLTLFTFPLSFVMVHFALQWF